MDDRIEPLAGPLDPGAQRLVDAAIAAAAPGPESGTPDAARDSFRTSRRALAPLRQDVAVVRTFDRSDAGPGLRLYRAWGTAEEERLPVLLFFHSGGWVSGDLDTHDNACRAIANAARCAVIAVDYALAPERPFPAAPEDAAAAYAFVVEKAEMLGIDSGLIAVGGDSAGANIAAVLALLLRDGPHPAPCGQVLMYPATSFVTETPSRAEFRNGPTLNGAALDWFAAQYLPDVSTRGDWRASPLLAASLAGLPAAYVATCGHDPLRDEGIAYAERLRQEGVRVEHRHFPGQIHGFLTMGGVMPETTVLIGEAAAALRKMFSGTVS
jgi:acetyl esterase